jgi:hypothetical protein
MRLSTIRALYPAIENIFDRHIKDAKFDGEPMKGRDFKDLKMAVTSLWHLQDKHKRMHPDTRVALIQALVIERDFQQASELIQKTANFMSISRREWVDPRETEKFKHEMKKAAAQFSDSQFLRRLEDTNDKFLRLAALNAKPLAQTELSSSIDTVVKTLTHDVLAMQQEICGRQVHLQMENEEMEVQKNALVEFIREINKKSAMGQNP